MDVIPRDGCIYNPQGDELELHIVDGVGFYTNLNYWDCECKEGYIHKKWGNGKGHCLVCECHEEEMPDSHEEEVQKHIYRTISTDNNEQCNKLKDELKELEEYNEEISKVLDKFMKSDAEQHKEILKLKEEIELNKQAYYAAIKTANERIEHLEERLNEECEATAWKLNNAETALNMLVDLSKKYRGCDGGIWDRWSLEVSTHNDEITWKVCEKAHGGIGYGGFSYPWEAVGNAEAIKERENKKCDNCYVKGLYDSCRVKICNKCKNFSEWKDFVKEHKMHIRGI